MKTSPSLANSNQDSMQEEWREGKLPRVELVGPRALRGWCFGQLGAESRKKDPLCLSRPEGETNLSLETCFSRGLSLRPSIGHMLRLYVVAK